MTVVGYIKNNIEKNISIDELAAKVFLSKDHLIRLFKQELGTTPLKYINQRKIERAQLMLVTQDIPVKAIAIKLSLDNYSYFNRLFKQLTGMTPNEYRKMHQQKA